MTYFLDTDTCIYALKGSLAIKERMRRISPKQIRISAIVRAELLFGAARSQNPKAAASSVERFLEPFDIVSFGTQEAVVHAKIKDALAQKGNMIGPHDVMIVATVMSHQGTMVTHNVKEFSRVEGLLVEDWL